MRIEYVAVRTGLQIERRGRTGAERPPQRVGQLRARGASLVGRIGGDDRRLQTRVAVGVGRPDARFVTRLEVFREVGSVGLHRRALGGGHVVAQEIDAAGLGLHGVVAVDHVVPVEGPAVGPLVGVDEAGVHEERRVAVAFGDHVAVGVAEDVAETVDILHLGTENHLVALLVGQLEQVGIVALIEFVAQFSDLEEVLLGLLPFLLPQVDLAAQRVGGALGHTAVAAVARLVLAGQLLAGDAVVQIVDDDAPHLLLRRAGAGVLPGSEVLQIDRNAPPEAVEAVVVEGAQEFALGDALAFESFAHRGARSDVVDHVVGAVDALVETFPVGQKRGVVGLNGPREVGVVEVDHAH